MVSLHIYFYSYESMAMDSVAHTLIQLLIIFTMISHCYLLLYSLHYIYYFILILYFGILCNPTYYSTIVMNTDFILHSLFIMYYLILFSNILCLLLLYFIILTYNYYKLYISTFNTYNIYYIYIYIYVDDHQDI